jgi:hypothetical protein
LLAKGHERQRINAARTLLRKEEEEISDWARTSAYVERGTTDFPARAVANLGSSMVNRAQRIHFTAMRPSDDCRGSITTSFVQQFWKQCSCFGSIHRVQSIALYQFCEREPLR